MSEYIIRSTHGKGARKYHTDENCHIIETIKTTQKVSQEYVEKRDLEECKICAGTVDRPDTQTKSLRMKLEHGEL